MAILRTEDGRTLSRHDEINELIGPTRIGTFALSPDSARLVASLKLPMSAEDADRLLENFDPALDSTLRAEGFVYRRVGCLTRGDGNDPRNKALVSFYTRPGQAGVMPAEMLKHYATPHRLEADERHHVHAGIIVKGLVLPDGKQVVVYVSVGEWILLHKTTLSWPIFPYDGPNIAVSYFDRPAPEGDFRMDLDPSLPVRISS